MNDMRATSLLIALCILASIYSWVAHPNFVQRNLVFNVKNLLEWRFWTLLTAIFVHANPVHLVGNMIFLYVFGNTLEEVVGFKKMLLAFFSGGVLSFPLSIQFLPVDASLVGASAAIFTLTAVVMLIKPLHFSWLLLMPVGLVAILYFLYNVFAMYYLFDSNVAYASHIVGFSLGLAFGIAWSKRWITNLLVSVTLLVVYLILFHVMTTHLLPSLEGWIALINMEGI